MFCKDFDKMTSEADEIAAMIKGLKPLKKTMGQSDTGISY